jgi:tRNA/rRNA methyltransferase
MSFWTYVLRCSDGSYYTGHTDDLEKRIAQHQSGELPGYTRERRPVELMWAESFPSREEALAAELQVKDWSRAKKEALFRSDWAGLSLAAKPPGRRTSRHDVSTGSTSARSERHRGEAVRVEQASSEAEKRRRDGSTGHAPAIVLVRPQLGENIGKAARAMLNFGLTDLRLVRPRDGWPNPSAGPAASGADIVLERARVFETVAEAVADCPYVYASTVRKRELVLPVVTPEQAALEIRTQAGASAILFGAERSGLETEEAAIAGKILTVPINPEFRSLNLAQAVILSPRMVESMRSRATKRRAEPRARRAARRADRQMDEALKSGYYFPAGRSAHSQHDAHDPAKAGWSNREIRRCAG